jgi:beta-N-acetylhexosaminidase
VVSRLSPPLTRLPPLSAFAALPPGERAAAARRYGRLQGGELAALGVTVDFSPVVDLKTVAPRWDRNSLIARRAIDADPAVAGEIAAAYAAGLRDAGIMPTAKHFPGLGRARGDTHHIRVRLSAPIAELEAADWRPFRQVLESGPALLMVGHAVLEATDPVRPASQSRAVIDGIIRRRWGFTGAVITDDLTMPSVFHHDFCGGVVRSLDAGVDFLLISYDADQYYRAFECALDGLRRKQIWPS